MPDYSRCKPGITGEGPTPSTEHTNQRTIDELLLHCLRTIPDPADDCRTSTLPESDWDDLLQQSARHGVTPLLYHRLQTIHPDIVVPPSVTRQLRLAYLENAARNLGLYRNLCKVLAILRRDNIPVIALKGAHLAERVYGSRALRFLGDLDILVRRSDLLKVDGLLLEMGCTPTIHNRVVAKDNNEFVYVMPRRDVSLEVHWSLLSPEFPFPIDTDGLWARSEPASIAGVEASVFGPEDLLLHLCLHAGCTHGFEPGMKLFCDINEVVAHFGARLDWGLVQCRAREWGVVKSVYLTLRMTRELLGTCFPISLLTALEPADFDEHLLALAMNQVFSRRPRTGLPLSMCPAVARFWGSARLRDKVVLFFKGFFITPEAMARLYPPPADSIRIYFYYFVRLRDLLRVYGRDIRRWLRRDQEMQAFAREGRDLTVLKDWLMSS